MQLTRFGVQANNFSPEGPSAPPPYILGIDGMTPNILRWTRFTLLTFRFRMVPPPPDVKQCAIQTRLYE